MQFYQRISELYDSIFPLNMAQVAYVKKGMEGQKIDSILDVGCGTGNLAMELAKLSTKTTAIDLDESMLEKARKKSQGIDNIEFQKLDMLALNQHFEPRSFDAVICFGNTLVHLDSEASILNFLKQTKKVLKDSGKLLVQIINYDRVIDNDIDFLPTIENDKLRFKRNYHLNTESERLDFETILTIKETGQEIRNNIELTPIRKAKLEEYLFLAGFETVNFFGNFKKEKLTKQSIPMVFEAQ